MKLKSLINWSVPIGCALFHCTFWGEKMGLNTLVFTLYLVGTLILKNKEEGISAAAMVTAFGSVLTAIMVVVNNSMLSEWVLILSMFATAGFMHRKDLEFVGFSFVATFRNLFAVPYQAIVKLTTFFARKEEDKKKAGKLITLGVAPVVLFVLFYWLYYLANPKFADITDQYWRFIGSFFSAGTSTISFKWVVFMTLTLFMTGGILWKPGRQIFEGTQSMMTDDLVRKRKKLLPILASKITPMSLKNEHQVAVLLIVSLNALLLFVNVLDVRYVWFNFQPLSSAELSNFVHEGTFVLIFSIFMAMAVLVYFFRDNLNFFFNNKTLKLLSLVWICQNAMLVFSVGMRNFHYINYYGLAYKRIGVVVFLLLTLIGLLLLWVKIRDRKTLYFLCHRNAWALYTVLVLSTFFNWDTLITRYNLTADTKENIDVFFLLKAVSDKNLYQLVEAQSILEENKGHRHENFVRNMLFTKEHRFIYQQKNYSFWSWNLPDHRNKQYFRQLVKKENQ